MAEIKIDDSLRPNSHKFKEEQARERKKLDPVVKSGSVISTKKSIGEKFADMFIKEDLLDVRDYIIYDVIIPGIKGLFLDTVGMMFFGNQYRRSDYDRGSYYGQSRKVSYSTKYNRTSRYDSEPYYDEKRRREKSSGYQTEDVDYRHVVLTSRVDAEEVVAKMRGCIREYGAISVAEFFDLIGKPGNNYNDNNWGWTDERDIGWRRLYNGGFLITVPEPVFID